MMFSRKLLILAISNELGHKLNILSRTPEHYNSFCSSGYIGNYNYSSFPSYFSNYYYKGLHISNYYSNTINASILIALVQYKSGYKVSYDYIISNISIDVLF